MRPLTRALAAIAASVMLAACSTSAPPPEDPPMAEYESTEDDSFETNTTENESYETEQSSESEQESEPVNPDELFLTTLEYAFPGSDIRGNKEQLIAQGHGFCGLIEMTGSVESLYQSRGDIMTGQLAEIDDEVFDLFVGDSIDAYCPKYG